VDVMLCVKFGLEGKFVVEFCLGTADITFWVVLCIGVISCAGGAVLCHRFCVLCITYCVGAIVFVFCVGGGVFVFCGVNIVFVFCGVSIVFVLWGLIIVCRDCCGHIREPTGPWKS
jgi:hypothetical protein